MAGEARDKCAEQDDSLEAVANKRLWTKSVPSSTIPNSHCSMKCGKWDALNGALQEVLCPDSLEIIQQILSLPVTGEFST